MSSQHPLPYQPPTPDEMQALMRRAHAQRAQAVRDMVSALLHLFQRKRANPEAGVACLSL